METYNHYMLTLIFEKPSKITYNILQVLRYIIYCDVHNFILQPKYMYSNRRYSYNIFPLPHLIMTIDCFTYILYMLLYYVYIGTRTCDFYLTEK